MAADDRVGAGEEHTDWVGVCSRGCNAAAAQLIDCLVLPAAAVRDRHLLVVAVGEGPSLPDVAGARRAPPADGGSPWSPRGAVDRPALPPTGCSPS